MGKLRQLAVEGLVDAMVGGPPCATWSRLRFRRDGPRPLRYDWCPWGRPDLRPQERHRIKEANACMLHSLALMEPTVQAGGLAVLEHPDDPEEEPMPSIWQTDEWKGFARRTGCTRRRFHQCCFGCASRKPTCLGNNVEGLQGGGPWCECESPHVMPKSLRESGGAYRSRRLSAYPPSRWPSGWRKQ